MAEFYSINPAQTPTFGAKGRAKSEWPTSSKASAASWPPYCKSTCHLGTLWACAGEGNWVIKEFTAKSLTHFTPCTDNLQYLLIRATLVSIAKSVSWAQTHHMSCRNCTLGIQHKHDIPVRFLQNVKSWKCHLQHLLN